MKKRFNRKGQFFLIMTGIIAVIIIGLATSVNYAITQPEPTVFYDLSKNFDVETLKVIDYGLFQAPPTANESLASFIANFTTYAKEKDPNIELVYLFGNEQSIGVYNIANKQIAVCDNSGKCTDVSGKGQEASSDISLEIIAGQVASKEVSYGIENIVPTSTSVTTPHVTIKLAGIEYDFYVPENNQFYFILRTEKGKEVHVIT